MATRPLFLPIGLAVLVAMGLMAGCGPSEADIATQTAAAWTATPVPTATFTPTPTPTPVPYDFSLQILNEKGDPVSWAEVILNGSEAAERPDVEGWVTWSDLPTDTVTFAVFAQGFRPVEFSATLERGRNEVSHTLERDPFGLLPTDACAPEESVLYVEDFQDGEAEGWPEIEARAGWDIREFEEGNLTLAGRMEAGPTRLQGQDFDNAVWRLRFMYEGQANPNLLWRDGGDAAYQVGLLSRAIGPGGMQRFTPESNVQVGRWSFNPASDVWYALEIATFDGVTNVWLDGEQLMPPYEDPDVWHAGTIGIEPWMNPGGVIHYDDFSVCELAEPFTSVYAAEGTQ